MYDYVQRMLEPQKWIYNANFLLFTFDGHWHTYNISMIYVWFKCQAVARDIWTVRQSVGLSPGDARAQYGEICSLLQPSRDFKGIITLPSWHFCLCKLSGNIFIFRAAVQNMNLNSWQLYSFNVVTVRLLPQLIYLCAVRQGNKMVHWIIGSMHSERALYWGLVGAIVQIYTIFGKIFHCNVKCR